MASLKDAFSNILAASVTMSAANTSTYSEIVTGISLSTKTGIVIDHIEYRPTVATIGEMTAASDTITMAFATSGSPGALALTDQTIIDMWSLVRHDMGAAAAAALFELPFTRYYAPPVIVAAPRLFFHMTSSGLANPGEGQARLYYRYIDLTDKEYLELAETFTLVG